MINSSYRIYDCPLCAISSPKKSNKRKIAVTFLDSNGKKVYGDIEVSHEKYEMLKKLALEV